MSLEQQRSSLFPFHQAHSRNERRFSLKCVWNGGTKTLNLHCWTDCLSNNSPDQVNIKTLQKVNNMVLGNLLGQHYLLHSVDLIFWLEYFQLDPQHLNCFQAQMVIETVCERPFTWNFFLTLVARFIQMTLPSLLPWSFSFINVLI